MQKIIFLLILFPVFNLYSITTIISTDFIYDTTDDTVKQDMKIYFNESMKSFKTNNFNIIFQQQKIGQDVIQNIISKNYLRMNPGQVKDVISGISKLNNKQEYLLIGKVQENQDTHEIKLNIKLLDVNAKELINNNILIKSKYDIKDSMIEFTRTFIDNCNYIINKR